MPANGSAERAEAARNGSGHGQGGL
jgi:hypothetical protein